jgi:hypothetical protein
MVGLNMSHGTKAYVVPNVAPCANATIEQDSPYIQLTHFPWVQATRLYQQLRHRIFIDVDAVH